MESTRSNVQEELLQLELVRVLLTKSGWGSFFEKMRMDPWKTFVTIAGKYQSENEHFSDQNQISRISLHLKSFSTSLKVFPWKHPAPVPAL